MRKSKDFATGELRNLKNLLLEKTGFYIRRNTLLIQTFTRSSYTTEQGGENNEILEFIGDQVLDYYVVKIIAKRYGALNTDCEYSFRVRENHFTSLKQELVNNNSLAKIIDDWGIAKYLIVGKSDYSNDVDKQVKVKADLFEAILGTIAIISEWDAAILEKSVSKMLSLEEKLNDLIKIEYRPVAFNMENAINTLKELAEHGQCSVPKYRYSSPEHLGYDKEGKPIWVCDCDIINDKTAIMKQVWASSKKLAKKAVAYLILCEYFELQNEYGINSKSICWELVDGKLIPGTKHYSDFNTSKEKSK